MCKENWNTDIYTHKILCQKWLISTATKKKNIKKNKQINKTTIEGGAILCVT